MKRYHIGLLARRHNDTGKYTAVFQFKDSIDNISCEILEYCGQRETTKVEAKARLRTTKPAVLEALRNKYPGKDFQNVVVE
jgi:hypothetical protein